MDHPTFAVTSLATASQPFGLPGESAGGAGTAAPGNGGAGGRPADPFGGGGSPIFLFVLLLLGAMIVFSLFGQRRDRKRREAMLGAIKKHDKVQTIGGVIGSIVEVKPDHIVLKVDESSNTRLTVARSAIQQVLTSAGPTEPKA